MKIKDGFILRNVAGNNVVVPIDTITNITIENIIHCLFSSRFSSNCLSSSFETRLACNVTLFLSAKLDISRIILSLLLFSGIIQ